MTALLALMLLCVAILCTGVSLLVAGLRGRMVAGVIECASCGFDLAGTDRSGVCPECGKGLAAPNAVRPRRARRRTLAAAGALLAVVGALPIATAVFQANSRFSLIQAAPVWWLQAELPLASPARAAQIGSELDIRLEGLQRSMTAREAKAIADGFSAMLADPSIAWNPGWSSFYTRARLQSMVTDEQWMRYIDRVLETTFRTRERVRAGMPLPAELRLGGTLAADQSTGLPAVFLQHRLQDLSIDGVKVDLGQPPVFAGYISRSQSHSSREDLPMPGRTGRFRVEARYLFEVEALDGTRIGSLSRSFETTVEVVGSDEQTVEARRDDALADEVRGMIRGVSLSINDKADLAFGMSTRDCRLDCAFEVILRPRDGALAGREIVLMPLTLQAGFGGGGFGSERAIAELGVADASSFDIVLRPSADVAEGSPTIRSVWMGPDIVFENIKPTRR